MITHFASEEVYFPSYTQWAAILLMGIGPFTLANILWDKATREDSVATISSLAFLTPLLALKLLAMFGFGTVSMPVLIGAFLAIIGVVFSARS